MNDIILTKWPQMIVWGDPVTIDQAKNIILRTDSFITSMSNYSGGNNHNWNKRIKSILGTDMFHKLDNWYEYEEMLRERIGYINLEYCYNDWASCAFIGGPHGWCHPDGEIGFGDNIGKWPTVEEVPVVPCVSKDSKSRYPVATPEQREAAGKAMQILSGKCDGARALDGAGFSKFDADTGLSLALTSQRGELTDGQVWLAAKLARRYHRQLPENLLEILGTRGEVDASEGTKA